MSFSTAKTLQKLSTQIYCCARQSLLLHQRGSRLLQTFAVPQCKAFSELHHQSLPGAGAALLNPITRSCSIAGFSQVHTKSSKELSDFLVDEIEAEKTTTTSEKLPAIEGFDISTNGSVITLTRQVEDEKITVMCNVSNTVDAAPPMEQFDAKDDKLPDMGPMVSRPDFSVEVCKGGQTLAFQCSCMEDTEAADQTEDAYSDTFQVDEVSFHNGEFKDNTYSVAADIMDGNLYDLLMNYLDDRGINNEFTDKLIQYSTIYEHNLYIDLLEKLKKFVTD